MESRVLEGHHTRPLVHCRVATPHMTENVVVNTALPILGDYHHRFIPTCSTFSRVRVCCSEDMVGDIVHVNKAVI